MNNDKRILEILKLDLKRWFNETPKDKKINEKQLYKELLDQIEYLEYTYKGSEKNES